MTFFDGGFILEAYTAVYCYRGAFPEVAKTTYASSLQTWSLKGGAYLLSRCVTEYPFKLTTLTSCDANATVRRLWNSSTSWPWKNCD